MYSRSTDGEGKLSIDHACMLAAEMTHPPPTIDVVRRYRCGDTTVSMCGGMPRALLLLLSYTPLLLLLM